MMFPLNNSEPAPADSLDLDWILVAVDRHGDGLIIDASPDFYKVDLITELFACDNGLSQPKGLAVGLYRVTNVRVWADDEDVDINGDWFAIYTQGIEASGEDANAASSRRNSPMTSHSPEVMQMARACAAKYWQTGEPSDENAARMILSGKWDDQAYVQATLEAIIRTTEAAAKLVDEIVPTAATATDAVVQASRDVEIAQSLRTFSHLPTVGGEP